MPKWGAVCFWPKGRRNIRVNGYDYLADKDTSSSNDSNGSSDTHLVTATVELVKKDGEVLGLIISGGVDKGYRPVITSLRPDSIAYRSEALDIGDVIISVNGIRVHNLKHEEIINMLKNAEGHVTLEIEFPVPSFVLRKPAGYTSRVIQVKLNKENGSFGLILRGSLHKDWLVVTAVKADSPAEREGTIKVGDRIMAIDSCNLSTAPYHEAFCRLQHISTEALLTVQYDVSVMDVVHNASGPLSVEMECPSSPHQLGLSLTQSSDSALIIESIKQGSIIERCGAVHVGDHVLSINHTKCEAMAPSQATELLLQSSTLNLEILPLSQLAFRQASPRCLHHTLSRRRTGLPPSTPVEPHSPTINWHHATTLPGGVGDGPELMLHRDPQVGYGLTLQQTGDGSWVVGAVDPGGPAAGLLRPGDRLARLNNRPVLGLLEVKAALTRPVLALQLEPRRSLLLSSLLGVRPQIHSRSGAAEAVRLVKMEHNGGPLGITISVTDDPLDPIVISNLIDNGLAQRLGTVHIGDQLLEVNGLSVQGKSLREVIHLIQASGHSVTLKLLSPGDSDGRKGTNNGSQNLSPSQEVVGFPNVDSAVESWGSSGQEHNGNGGEEWEDGESWAGSRQSGDWSSVLEDLELLRPDPIPLPVEVHQVTLFKDQVYEDFGFSVSDGLYDKGVYINRIRPGGPADLSGILRPLDRILHVNNTRTYDFDCCLTVPLIAASGDKIELVVSRPAYQFTKSL